MRTIQEIKKEILQIKEEIAPDAWERLQKLLDEIFLAYYVQAKEADKLKLIDELGHYERHCPALYDIHAAISDFRSMVELSGSEAKLRYELEEMWRLEQVKEGSL